MRALYLLLYTLSGFCLLTLETIWIRTLAVALGNTVISATLVVSLFFLCAGAGNLWSGRRSGRAANPLRLYAFCELGCALTALTLFFCRENLSALCLAGAPQSLAHKLCYTAALIGVPSFFAGGTLPALAQAFVPRADRRTAGAGGLYAANMCGAALGVLGGGVALPMVFGFAHTYYGAGALLAAVATAAWVAAGRLWKAPPAPPAHVAQAATLPGAQPIVAPQGAGWKPAVQSAAGYALLAGSGALSLALEILTLAYFRLLIDSSLYTLTAVLFSFILNLALGAFLAASLRRRNFQARPLLFAFLTAAGVLGFVYPQIYQNMLYSGLFAQSVSAWGRFLSSVLAAWLLPLPWLVCVGTVFPLAWEMAERHAGQGRALGRMVALNKCACAAGAFAAPFIVIPAIGHAGALMLCGWLYLALGLALACLGPRFLRRAVLAGILIAAGVPAFVLRPVPVALEPGAQLLSVYEGPDGVVACAEDAQGSRHIILNQSYTLNGTQRALLAQKHESWIPLALHPHAQRVAFIGMASGISATAALDFPLAALDAIELVPEVVRTAKTEFSQWNARLFSDPRVRVLVQDGRFIMRSAGAPYDVVICDLLRPSQEGTEWLYSRDFFHEVRARLAPGGQFCLWLPMHQLNAELAGIVLHTFLEVFPNCVAVRGNLEPLEPIVGLVGSAQPIDLSNAALAEFLNGGLGRELAAQSPFFRRLADFRLVLLGDLRAAAEDFQEFPVNTDDYPALAFRAGRRLAPGDALRGITFLRWFGTRFLERGFPSCHLGDISAEDLRRGIRAGNYYFAASVYSLELPGSDVPRIQRARQALQALESARALAPESDIGLEEVQQQTR